MSANTFIWQGFKDLTLFTGISGYTYQNFLQEIFNVCYHLSLPRSEVMSWSAEERRDTWERFTAQQELEARARDKAMGKRD